MNYQQTIGYLFSQLPMFHRIGPAAYKANLDNTLALSEYFGHPERSFPCIHIAGTNGKGSVAHMLAAILQQQGYKTGLATSPHLKDFRERIRINGRMIPKSWVTSFVKQHKGFFEQIKPSFFELTIALTFKYFAEQQLDVAVIETGLGGRLDSTNIVHPEVSVITNIGYDHMNLLGNTLEKIAAEKAGIIKPGVPVVIGKLQQDIHHVFEQKAASCNSPLSVASADYRFLDQQLLLDNGQLLQKLTYNTSRGRMQVATDLLGLYQRENVATVLQAVDVLTQAGRYSVHSENLHKALGQTAKLTGLKGRWQVLGKRPLAIADTAHNADGIMMVMQQLQSVEAERLRIVFGMVDDKDIESVLGLLPTKAIYYFTRPDVPRGMDSSILAEKARKLGLNGKVFPSVRQALDQARQEAGKKDVIFVGGSTFVVAEVV